MKMVKFSYALTSRYQQALTEFVFHAVISGMRVYEVVYYLYQ